MSIYRVSVKIAGMAPVPVKPPSLLAIFPHCAFSGEARKEQAMMALRRPALLGAGRLAAPRRPARWTAVRAGWAARERRGVCGGR